MLNNGRRGVVLNWWKEEVRGRSGGDNRVGVGGRVPAQTNGICESKHGLSSLPSFHSQRTPTSTRACFRELSACQFLTSLISVQVADLRVKPFCLFFMGSLLGDGLPNLLVMRLLANINRQ